MKKHTLVLDLGDEPEPFEGWSFLLFRTTLPGYLFADGLNRLYDYRLSRVDDILLDGNAWPLYIHLDPVRQLRHFLIEQPAPADSAAQPRRTGSAGPWNTGDKLLVIKGNTAPDEAARVLDDFSALPGLFAPDSAALDLRARQRLDILHQLLEGFTVASLLTPDAPTPPKNTQQKSPSRATRPANTSHRQASLLCSRLIEYIETHRLDLSDEERRRIESNVFVNPLGPRWAL